jgi:exosortase
MLTAILPRRTRPPEPVSPTLGWGTAGALPLLIGVAVFVVSAAIGVARQSWVSDDAAHSPVILAIGSWLLARSWRDAYDPSARGSVLLALVALLPTLFLHLVARSLDWGTIAGYTAWLSLVVVAYAMFGAATLRRLWFPIFYILIALPLPAGTTVILTHDIRLFLSDLAVSVLAFFDYPVARAGITMVVDRYELLVEDACSGLNSLISLTAVGLFYAYARHGSSAAYSLIFTVPMVLVAIFANLVRIILLMLITYHFGDAAAKGILHDVTGLVLFGTAVLGMFAVDKLLAPVRHLLRVRG